MPGRSRRAEPEQRREEEQRQRRDPDGPRPDRDARDARQPGPGLDGREGLIAPSALPRRPVVVRRATAIAGGAHGRSATRDGRGRIGTRGRPGQRGPCRTGTGRATRTGRDPCGDPDRGDQAGEVIGRRGRGGGCRRHRGLTAGKAIGGTSGQPLARGPAREEVRRSLTVSGRSSGRRVGRGPAGGPWWWRGPVPRWVPARWRIVVITWRGPRIDLVGLVRRRVRRTRPRGDGGGTGIVGQLIRGHGRSGRRRLGRASARSRLGGLAAGPVLERRADRERAREAVRLLMRERAWCGRDLGVAAVPMIRARGTLVTLVLERDEGAGRRSIDARLASVAHRGMIPAVVGSPGWRRINIRRRTSTTRCAAAGRRARGHGSRGAAGRAATGTRGARPHRPCRQARPPSPP